MENKFRKVTLKNVLTPTGEADFIAEVMPFNRRDDGHVRFAFAFSDMLNRMPSELRNVSDAAVAYAELFMCHKAEDAKDSESAYACIIKDERACRVLFNQAEAQREFDSFFTNA